VTIVIPAEPAEVEPCNSENGNTKLMSYNVIQGLTVLDPESREVGPLLATSWEQTAPTTWVFQLREGVTFHDGAPFDAEAAAFGLNRALNNTAFACSNTSKISSGVVVTPTVTGPYELTIDTAVEDPILDRELSYIELVSPNTPTDKETDVPIGTGAYIWDNWDHGRSITLTRFDGYWGDAPAVETATLIWRSEDSQRANVVLAGEADIAYTISDSDAPDNDRTKSYEMDTVFALRLPVTVAPFTDLRVRQAFQYAINKQQITDALLGRTGEPYDQFVAPSNNGYAPNLPATTYDLDKAKALLAEAAADGIDVTAPIQLIALAGHFAGGDEVEQAVTQDLQKAGFNITLSLTDSEAWKEQLFRDTMPTGSLVVLGVKHDNTSGDGSSTFTSYYASNGCCGTAVDPTLDQLVSKALQSSGYDRVTAFEAVGQYAYTKDLSVVPVAQILGLMMLSDRVEYEPNPLTASNGIRLDAVSLN
jgi:peptide/nickel transport system substrate-binding protein